MGIGLTAFMFGIAVFLTVYAIKAPVHELPRDDVAFDVFGDTDIRDTERPKGVFDKYVRPALRNFLPQTPMDARIKARHSNKIVELLVQSGNPWNIQPEEYHGLRLLFALVGFFLGLLLGINNTIPQIPTPGMMLLGAIGGFMVPKVIHDGKRGKRKKAATRGLPEALDLLVITLNSGQNFQPALAEVTLRLPDGLIKDELKRVAQDLRSGKSLTRTMTDFARRSPSDEVEAFCNSVLQSERNGSDVAETLVRQAESARVAYEAMLDEKIGKLPTTLYFPILMLMLPALFIVILAPAFSDISKSL